MRKTIVTMLTFTLVGLMAALPNYQGYAEKSMTEIKDERSEIIDDLSDAEEEIADVLLDLEELNKEIENIDELLAENKKQVDKIKDKIKDKEEEIDELQDEINELEEKIEERYEIMKKRIVSYQKSGGDVQYLEVLFDANSFSDFINRSSAVSTISEADKDLMKKQEYDKEEVEDKQDKVEQKQDELEDEKAEKEEIRDTIKNQKKQNEKSKKKLETKEMDLKEMKSELENENSDLKDLENDVRESMKQTESSSSSNSQLTETSITSGKSDGAKLAWPTDGEISSEYGSRSHGFHYGIDIANSKGTPIYAAESGTVKLAEYSESYGNVVYLHHPDLDLTTVYAHMSSLDVSNGDKVSTGDTLGKMGNTGHSFGSHSHFEVHKGDWSYHGGLDPIIYLE